MCNESELLPALLIYLNNMSMMMIIQMSTPAATSFLMQDSRGRVPNLFHCLQVSHDVLRDAEKGYLTFFPLSPFPTYVPTNFSEEQFQVEEPSSLGRQGITSLSTPPHYCKQTFIPLVHVMVLIWEHSLRVPLSYFPNLEFNYIILCTKY